MKNGWEKDGEYDDEVAFYYFNGIKIILILNNTYHGIESYCAIVVNNTRKNAGFSCNVYDENLEVLKFKAVLKAKDLGWNIKRL